MLVKKLSRLLQHKVLRPDSNLVHLPPNVGRCEVFRNAISMEEQERIHMEWWEVLEKEGQQQVIGSSINNKRVKNVSLEIYGEKNFTEVKSSQKREVSRLPGFTWSPTMRRILEGRLMPLVEDRQQWRMRKKGLGKEEVGDPMNAGSQVSLSFHNLDILPDMGRVVEHTLPGYEMHVEHPTVGSFFLYLNMLSDTVLVFDDEASGREGNVYLPAGSVMYVAEEARWGFRFGEVSEPYHTFITPLGLRRRVETDVRLSIQLWKFHPGLLGYDSLRSRLDHALEVVEKKLEKVQSKEEVEGGEEEKCDKLEKLKDTKEAVEALRSMKTKSFADVYNGNVLREGDALSISSFSSTANFKSDEVTGSGRLGGDMPDSHPPDATSLSAESLLKHVKGDFNVHRAQFTKIQGVLEEMKLMQTKGQPVNETWMKNKISENNVEDAERDAKEGFNPNDIEGSWDKVDGKAKFYKAKLRSMDYDGTAFLHSRMPDISQEAPLDMKGTIKKIVPYVRGGEKMLKNLPQM